MNTIITGYMRELPVGYKTRMRELTLGPIAWGMWSWTFHDGSTRAAVLVGPDRDIQAWASLTPEVDLLPVIGVYVPEELRGAGLAAQLVRTLLLDCLATKVLSPGDAIYAATQRWSAYPAVIASCGLVCRPWV